MTHDWETARPTDLWNFLFMFRFNKKKISHVWLFYTAAKENALESYEKYLLSALEHVCRQTRRQGHIMALLFSQLSMPRCFPCTPRRRRRKYQHTLHFLQSPNPFFHQELRWRNIWAPTLLFLKWSPLQNAACFAPHYAFQRHKCPEYGVWGWFCE